MERENKLSIWIGKFSSKDELSEYMKEKYTDDGDLYSSFMNSFKIDYIDNQFQEVLFQDNNITKEDIFSQFSYSESFIDLIPNDKNWTLYNSFILLYDFEYEKNVENDLNFIFLGVFEYKKY